MISELKQIEAAHTGVVAMGYSANYRLSFFRPELVFDGQPYALDGASMMDWRWSGRPFPASALTALRDCAVDVWVIPSGAPPFVLPNDYPIAGDVFPDEFPEDIRGALCARDVRPVVRRVALPAVAAGRVTRSYPQNAANERQRPPSRRRRFGEVSPEL